MKKIALTLAALTSLAVTATAEDAPKDEALALATILDAARDNDLEKFESVCDEAMKTGMTPEKLDQVSGQIAPLMKEGYETSYMGVLDRGVVNTYYWKLDYEKEGIPDMLAELSFKDGKVAGFFIR
ncbi:hypothetical protein [Luteolibacter sp. AS25]|uniref:hypothetical protein n=1 Tax=Luteolibacter sp. AS25 TaxID=3135776 RepID=UPI00398B26C6